MTTEIKYPIPSAEQETIEEALGTLWEKIFEKNELNTSENKSNITSLIGENVCQILLRNHYLQVQGDILSLTDSGKILGQDVTRRHRLAERLLTDVLALSHQQIDTNACQLEHILSKEVTDSICTLLGHPQQCPHGHNIPQGACCNRTHEDLHPIIASLDKLNVGQKGKVAYLALQNHPDLHKLLSLGLIPGTLLHLHQLSPTPVIEIGETTLALELEIAEKIFVRIV